MYCVLLLYNSKEGMLMSNPVTIRCREHGPLVIPLDPGVVIKITDHLGQPFAIPEGKPSIALCRCGASQRKPFCDGSHKTCGFQANEAAVPPPVTT